MTVVERRLTARNGSYIKEARIAMLVTIHAIVLVVIFLATVVGALVAIKRTFRRDSVRIRRDLFRATGVTLVGMLIVSLTTSLMGCMCSKVPDTQFLLAGFAIWICWYCLGDMRFRKTITAGLIVVMSLLSGHHASMAHSDLWSTGRWSESLFKARNEASLHDVQKIVQEKCAEDENNYPAGWLDEMPFMVPFLHELSSYQKNLDCVEIGNAWHSGFTRLYPYRKTPLRIWFPGGVPAEAAEDMTLREVSPG